MQNKLIIFLLASAWAALLPAQAVVNGLRYTPARPQPGETIRFEYDLTQSPLRHASDEVSARVLEFSENTPSDCPIALFNTGDKLVGTFTPDAKTRVVVLAFEADERFDNNAGAGYFIPMRGPDGRFLPESRAAQALLYRNWGHLLDLDRRQGVALEWLEAEFADHPDLRKKYFSPYLYNLLAVRRGEDSKKIAMDLLDQVEKDPQTPEKDLLAAVKLYDRLEAADRSAALKERLRRDFPQGLLVQQERQQAIQTQNDLARREAMIEEYIQLFPPKSDADHDAVSLMRFRLATKLGEQKVWDKFDAIAETLRPDKRADLYNNVAWDLAEHGEDLARAKMLAAWAAEWSKSELASPTLPKPAYETQRGWKRQREMTFAQCADTYAYVLDKNGDPHAALKWQQQVVEISEGESTDMNERLTGYLERANAPDLRYRLEGFILKGQATEAMKTQFKRLYLAEDRSEAGSAAYLAHLEKAAKAHRRQQLASEMLDLPAAAFSLKNLAGETVSLESLRGKVVVVDFWATWCGPCKASFPGMQQAVDRYKNDPQVAFVFVDTWERSADKAKTAGDFIQEKGYTFNVLLDLDDRVVADYGVSGIPTKFVLDKTGRIRFKSIGFSGSADALVEEMELMIDLAKAQP